MKITRLAFLGYRSFRSSLDPAPTLLDVPLRPLTLVLGKNGSGKTQLLRLLRHAVAALSSKEDEPLPIRVGEEKFGEDPLDLLHRRHAVAPLDLCVEAEAGGHRVRVTARLRGSSTSEPLALVPLSHEVLEDGRAAAGSHAGLLANGAASVVLREAASRALANSVALGPVREAFKPSYPKPSSHDARRPWGAAGDGVPARLLADETLLRSTSAWLAEHLPPIRLSTRQEFNRVAFVDEASGMNLTEAAAGVHQALPMVALLLHRAAHPSVGFDTIQQPELHLHDAAHPLLGDLLLGASGLTGDGPRPGRVVMVETHSEGLLLRLRRRVAEGRVGPDDISVLFVDPGPAGSSVRRIPLLDDGFMPEWPEGVFANRFQEVQAIHYANRARERHATRSR